MSELPHHVHGLMGIWSRQVSDGFTPLVSIRELTTVHHAIMESKGFHDLPGTVYAADTPALVQIAGMAPMVEKLGEIAQAIRKDLDTDPLTAQLAVQATDFWPVVSGDQYARATLDEMDTPLATSRTAIAGRLVLIVTEIGEALEALRKGDLLGFMRELADILLRLVDIVGVLQAHPDFAGMDFTKEVLAKMWVNMDRPHMHGRKA